MDVGKDEYRSDAEWYCKKDSEKERFYEIFFSLCRKYRVRWASADEKERAVIEGVTRVTYERDRIVRQELSNNDDPPVLHCLRIAHIKSAAPTGGGTFVLLIPSSLLWHHREKLQLPVAVVDKAVDVEAPGISRPVNSQNYNFVDFAK